MNDTKTLATTNTVSVDCTTALETASEPFHGSFQKHLKMTITSLTNEQTKMR